MAKIPSDYLDRNTIANMEPGEVRYTVPWAMFVDRKGECWLHPNYPASPEPGGTVCMELKLTDAGFVVTAKGTGHSWTPGGSVTDYAGGQSVRPIPVHEVF